MKVLITGAHGFLGQHIRKKFESAGYYIDDGYSGALTCHSFPEFSKKIAWCPTRLDCNVESRSSVFFAIQEFKPDAILHMAALCGGILKNKNSPADFLQVNTRMGLNIYEAAQKCNVKKVYSLGSVCAYPKDTPAPFCEDNLWQDFPDPSNAPYGIAKRVLLMLSQTYRQQYGIGGAHLIPVNLYGTHDTFDLVSSHVVPALINKFINAVENNLPQVECWGHGKNSRELLFVEDAAEVITNAVLTNFDHEEPINIGVGKDILIKDLAILIKKLTGYKGKIIFNQNGDDGQPKRLLDTSRAKQLLNWEATTTLEDGLKKTIEWYKENKDKL